MEVIESLLAYVDGHRERAARPFVTLSYAQSLDGCISARAGEPLALSGPESLRLTHTLRSHHDAILVGIGTVLSDDPQLSVRFVEGKNPQPVVLDSRLRIPLNAALLTTDARRPWICTRDNPDPARVEALEQVGARVMTLPSTAKGQVCLSSLLGRLAEMGVNSLMVEGGARIITSFVLDRLADFIVLTVVPVFIGGMRAVSELGQSDPQRFVRVTDPHYERLGGDLILWGRLGSSAR